MKLFAKYMIALLCFVFILDRAGGYIFNKLYIQNKVGKAGGKINYYLSFKTPPDLLIMGSSRALLQVIPDSFKVSCFNLAHEGMDDVFQTGLLDIIITHKKIPKTILLHIDPESYFNPYADTHSTDIQNLSYYYGKDQLVTQYLNEVSDHEKYFFFFNLYRYNGRAISLIKHTYETLYSFKPSNGFEPLMPNTDDSINTITMAKQEEKSNDTFKPSRLRYLLKFMDLCKENHIQLILFTSPVYNNTYESGQLDAILRAKNIPYINYLVLGLPAVENKPTLWKDPGHLNYEGAQYESGDLANRVMKLLNSKY